MERPPYIFPSAGFIRCSRRRLHNENRPSLVETNVDKDDFLRLKHYSAQPTAQWLCKRARSALSEFVRSSEHITLIEKEWKKLKNNKKIFINTLLFLIKLITFLDIGYLDILAIKVVQTIEDRFHISKCF